MTVIFFEQLHILKASGDPFPDDLMRLVFVQIFPVEYDLPGHRRIESADAIKHGRFASPVRSDERVNYPLGHFKREVVDRSNSPESYRYMTERQHTPIHLLPVAITMSYGLPPRFYSASA